MNFSGKKSVSQDKYAKPAIELKLDAAAEGKEHSAPAAETKQEDVVLVREIFNLEEQLIQDIENFVHQEKQKGVQLWDIKSQKKKKINKSLWAREVFKKALDDAGYYKDK